MKLIDCTHSVVVVSTMTPAETLGGREGGRERKLSSTARRCPVDDSAPARGTTDLCSNPADSWRLMVLDGPSYTPSMTVVDVAGLLSSFGRVLLGEGDLGGVRRELRTRAQLS